MRTTVYGALLAAGVSLLAFSPAQAAPATGALAEHAGAASVLTEQVATKKRSAKRTKRKARRASRQPGPRASTRSAGEGQPSGQTPPTR